MQVCLSTILNICIELISVNCFISGTSDYTEISDQILSFDLLSNREVLIDVTINNDNIFENDETFSLTLSQPSPLPTFPPVAIQPSVSTITIVDDDSKQHLINFPVTIQQV